MFGRTCIRVCVISMYIEQLEKGQVSQHHTAFMYILTYTYMLHVCVCVCVFIRMFVCMYIHVCISVCGCVGTMGSWAGGKCDKIIMYPCTK